MESFVATDHPPVAERESLRRDIPATIDLTALPAHATFMRILGVNYVCLRTEDQGDLYVTEYGLPFIQHLLPQNWYADDWFIAKRQRLEGTSAVYRVPTRPIEGHLRPSIDVVVKWSRVGQDVPLDTFTLNRAINAEFNTPFEEFSLLQELRQGRYGPRGLRMLTQKPLAIYVPPDRMQPWQTGRSKGKILSKIARHPAVEIDILRAYILLYGWVRGWTAVEAYRQSPISADAQQQAMLTATQQVNAELEQKGFLIADNKPAHVIVRTGPDGQPKRRRDGRLVYAIIDYELMARTPAYQTFVKASGRSRYLQAMRDRFKPRTDGDAAEFPPHLHPCQVLGIPYVYGRTESTNGALFVVGRDPELFNYFLPERWRTKQVRLSPNNLTYYTQTKDSIHLVWKVSRVGELPPGESSDRSYMTALLHGFNCPFEEFSLALELQSLGVRTVYPRAIYMTGQHEVNVTALDDRRFERHRALQAPDGHPVLPMDHDFICIWGYWRGLEDEEAPSDSHYWTPIDAQQAARMGLLTPHQLDELVERQRLTLLTFGFEDLAIRGDHILLSYIPPNTLKRDAYGRIETRQCNFELVRRISPQPPGA